jgi:hypothetical protein
VPLAAEPGSTSAIATAWPSDGARLPLVTVPTVRPPTTTGLPSRAARFESNASPTRIRSGASERRLAARKPPRASGRIVEVHGQAEADRQRIARGHQFVAVERHAGLEPERVAGPEAAGPEPPRSARIVDRLPDLLGRGGRHDHLDAVFARVARAAHRRGLAGHEGPGGAVAAQPRDPARVVVAAEHAHGRHRERPLHGDHGGVGRPVGERHAGRRQPRAEPRHHAVAVARVDHQREPGRAVGRIGLAGHQRVVEDREAVGPFVAGDERVAGLPDADVGHTTGEERLEPVAAAGALDGEPAHVRHVEHPRGLAGGEVLVDDRRILHRHPPAGEVDHATAVRLVPGGQGRAKRRR